MQSTLPWEQIYNINVEKNIYIISCLQRFRSTEASNPGTGHHWALAPSPGVSGLLQHSWCLRPMSTSWLLHIHVTCQTSLLGRSTLAPTPQLATLLCEVITLILSTGGQLASLEMHQNLDCIKYHPVIWESKKLGNARRFTHSGELSELKPPKPL